MLSFCFFLPSLTRCYPVDRRLHDWRVDCSYVGKIRDGVFLLCKSPIDILQALTGHLVFDRDFVSYLSYQNIRAPFSPFALVRSGTERMDVMVIEELNRSFSVAGNVCIYYPCV